VHIDAAIEERVRAALGAVIDRDGDGMVSALAGLTSNETRHALGLGLFVVGYVVNNIHPDGVTEAEIASLAQQVTESESDWISLNPESVRLLLTAGAKGDATLRGIDPNDALGLTFVVGGHLLAAYRAEPERWFEYLDEIWAALSAASDTAAIE
jgi:hypothetical protein